MRNPSQLHGRGGGYAATNVRNESAHRPFEQPPSPLEKVPEALGKFVRSDDFPFPRRRGKGRRNHAALSRVIAGLPERGSR
jgi:hypothetical protein